MIAAAPHPRREIYYWKCDRPAAFHGTTERSEVFSGEAELASALATHFSGASLSLRPAGGQGNHRTYFAGIDGDERFVRIEDGPEGDDYLEVETAVLHTVRAFGLPAPIVFAVDATRQTVPFAWQVMERIAAPDLNHHHKQGRLDLPAVAEQIGAAVARWQRAPVQGFGPFDPELQRTEARLQGFHATYADYYHRRLSEHLAFLVDRAFLPLEQAREIERTIADHRELLAAAPGCLVHKDLALWNILGTPDRIAAFIDWDDAIAGDPLDDLSLLGCFYDGPVLARALAGYQKEAALPAEYRRRFWLHLLRNMLVKAVIRVGAGYFDRADGFYLIGTGSSGADLRTFTRARLHAALQGLRENRALETL